MKKIVLLMIAKGTSKRLKNKNKKIYKGKQMFLWNLKKGLSITKNFYFNSDDNEMIAIDKKLGLKIIQRNNNI